MKFNPVWKLFIIFAVALAGCMTVTGLWMQKGIHNSLVSHLRQDALTLTQTLARAMPPSGNAQDLDTFANEFSRVSGMRITIVRSADGKVLGESSMQHDLLENHFDRPEIQQAIRLGSGFAMRFSDTLGMKMLYSATLVADRGIVMRVSAPVGQVMQIKNRIMLLVSIVLFLAPMLALLVAFLFARHLSAVPAPR